MRWNEFAVLVMGLFSADTRLYRWRQATKKSRDQTEQTREEADEQ